MHSLSFYFYSFSKKDGGVVTPTDMESGSKLLNLRELSFLTFTTLRALSGIMHGQLDHVRTGSHEIKHSDHKHETPQAPFYILYLISYIIR